MKKNQANKSHLSKRTVVFKKSNQYDFWYKMISILNAIVPSTKKLTDTELNVLVNFLLLDTDKNLFLGDNRKAVKDKLNYTEPKMAVHLSNIRKKGWIKDNVLISHLEQLRTSDTRNLFLLEFIFNYEGVD